MILNTWRARGWKASCSLYHLLRETFMTTNTAAMCVPSVEAAPQTHMPRYSGGLTLFLSFSRSLDLFGLANLSVIKCIFTE